MRRRTVAFAVPAAAVVALAAGALNLFGGPADAEEEEATVKALRFRQLIVESGLDFAHGGERWHDVLFLPDRKLVAQVVWETEVTWKPEFRSTEIPRMHVFEGTLEDQLEARPNDDAEGKKEPEEIRIPAALAKEIADLAELTKRQKAASARLGRAAVDARAVGGKDTVTFR